MKRRGQEAHVPDLSKLDINTAGPQVQAAMRAAAGPGEGTSAGAQGREPPDLAAHMRQLAHAGLVCQPTLEADDPRLRPVDGMSFDVYVRLAAKSITDPATGILESRGIDLGMSPGTTGPAFEKWSNKVVSDAELGIHYTALLQAEIASGREARCMGIELAQRELSGA